MHLEIPLVGYSGHPRYFQFIAGLSQLRPISTPAYLNKSWVGARRVVA